MEMATQIKINIFLLVWLHMQNFVKESIFESLCQTGVYKHWTGLLEWWNSGMVDWIFLFGFLIIYDVSSL